MSEKIDKKKKKIKTKKPKTVAPARFKIIDEDGDFPSQPAIDNNDHSSKASCSDREASPDVVLIDNNVDELRLYGKFRVDTWTSKTETAKVKTEAASDDDSDLDVPRKKADPTSSNTKQDDSDSDISIQGRSVKRSPKAGSSKSSFTIKNIKREIKHEESDDDGRNREAIKRTKQYKNKRERTKKEPTAEELKRMAEMKAKYEVWNKGTKQVTERRERIEEMTTTLEQPFARYKDDDRLEDDLKNRLHEDDPMFAYMAKKRKSAAQNGQDSKHADKPKYKGHAPPNRFGILPGVRWDGLDRSNGFEKKLLSVSNLKKADEDEYYAWSSGHFD